MIVLSIIEINIYEIIGYLASLVVLISLLMSSVKKLRWINLAGSSLFCLYGVFIQAWPVAIMNFGIVLINIYYLRQMYRAKDYFTLVEINHDSTYFNHFLTFYKENMERFMNVPDNLHQEEYLKLFILRNMVPAGLLVCRKKDTITLEIIVDYATPTYRDFKIGKHVFTNELEYFRKMGIKILITSSSTKEHALYLEKMGFIMQETNSIKQYQKDIE